MVEGALERPADQARWLRVAAFLIAAAQIPLAYRAGIGYADDFWVTATIAWLAALYLLSQNRDLPADTGTVWRIVGALLALGTVIAMAVTPGYRTFDRLMPLIAGVGLGLAAFGPALRGRLGGALALLALPLINPVPQPVRRLVTPALVYVAAHGAMLIHRVAGSPVVLEGAKLTTPGGVMDILDGCSGILAMSRLWVVAALVAALFPTTTRQKVLLFAIGAVVGILMNVAHVAVMAQALVRGNESSFDYWHQGGGAALFAVGSMGAAGLGWWLVTRRPST
jgi:exosortase/archaeosortase family protein